LNNYDDNGTAKIDLVADVDDFSQKQLRKWEKDLVGVYISDHPLLSNMDQIEEIITAYSVDLSDMDGKVVTLAGTIARIRVHTTKKGYAMAFVSLEDLHGFADLVVFPDVWKQVEDWLEIDTLVAVSGKVDTKRGEANLLVSSIDRDLRVVEVADDQVAKQSSHQNIQPSENDQGTEELEAVQMVVEIQRSRDVQLPDNRFVTSSQEDVLISNEHERSETLLESKSAIEDQSSKSLRRIVVTLRPEDNQSDYQLRVKWAFNVLNSFPGEDRFVMVVYEGDHRCFELDFSNHTTGYCEELRNQLMQVVNSPDDIEVQSLLL